MMLTLTLDPDLFDSPEAAWRYVREHRCIAVMMQRLDRWGLVKSREFFAVVEWQKKSEMPHWHVLVDASFIDIERVREAWNRNWKGWQQRIAAGRPGFGAVRYSRKRGHGFKSAEHAANYASKYITKHPEQGYPEWVMQSGSRAVHRYSASRGFWRGVDDQEQLPTPDDECSEDPDEPEQGVCGEASQDEPQPSQRPRRTVAEVVADCGERTAIFEIREGFDAYSGEQVEQRRFLGRIDMPLTILLLQYPARWVDEKGRRAVLPDEWVVSMLAERHRQPGRSEEVQS